MMENPSAPALSQHIWTEACIGGKVKINVALNGTQKNYTKLWNILLGHLKPFINEELYYNSNFKFHTTQRDPNKMSGFVPKWVGRLQWGWIIE